MAIRSETVFVAANVFPIWSDSLYRRPLYLGRLLQNAAGPLVALSPIDPPKGDFQFAYPRVISDNHVLHLVWSEFDSPPRTRSEWMNLELRPTTLWHSAFSHGSWSPPTEIATSYWIGWNEREGGVAVDGAGTLHVAAWTADTNAKPRVNDFRQMNGLWETSVVAYVGLERSSAIAAQGDTIVVAVVAERRATDTLGVLLVKSTDRGRHWAKPGVAAQRIGGLVDGFKFARIANELVLVTAEKPPNSYSFDTLRIVRVREAGAAQDARAIDAPPGSAGMEVGSGCGSIVVLLPTLTGGPVFEMTVSRESAVTVRPFLHDAATVVAPAIIATARSIVAVFAYQTVKGETARSAAMSVPECST